MDIIESLEFVENKITVLEEEKKECLKVVNARSTYIGVASGLLAAFGLSFTPLKDSPRCVISTASSVTFGTYYISYLINSVCSKYNAAFYNGLKIDFLKFIKSELECGINRFANSNIDAIDIKLNEFNCKSDKNKHK